MESTLIVSSATYADKEVGAGTIATMAEINNLAVGAIAMFDSLGNVIDPIIPAIVGDAIHIAVGRTAAQGGALLISNVQRADFGSEPALVPQAAVNKLMTIGACRTELGDYNLPTLVDNDEATIIVEDLSKKVDDNTRTKRYSITVTPTDTDATVTAAMVAKINADAKRIVNASDSGAAAGIELTGNSNVNFRAVGLGVLGDADITEYQMRNNVYDAALVADNTAYSKGWGTYDDVVKLEYDAMINRGHSSSFTPLSMWKVNSMAVSGSLYHIYQCQFMNQRLNNPTTASNAFTQKLALCILNNGGVPVVDITTIIAAI